MSQAVPTAPAPPSPFGRAWGVLRFAARALLGLFVLGQALFLVAVNVVDMKEAARDSLTESRKNESWLWTALTCVPPVRETFTEWLDPPGAMTKEETKIGRLYAWLGERTDWWGRRAGQEQGWSLFAPDVVDWTSFPAVELRWDEDAAPGKAAHAPVRLLSENEPSNRRRFVRIGKFRLRKFESNFEMDLRSGVSAADLESHIERKVDRKRDEILVYLRLRWRQYSRAHPDAPTPAQVILHVHCWTIPEPPGNRPWDWTDRVETPVARWRPGRGRKAETLERYVVTEKAFR